MITKEYFAKIKIRKAWIEPLEEITEEGAYNEGYSSRADYFDAFFRINKIKEEDQAKWMKHDLWAIQFELDSIHKPYFIESGEFGWIEFRDCLSFMQNLPDNSLDLIFTDPPWGHDYDGTKPMGINQQAEKHDRVNYNDTFAPNWNLKWFHEACRVSHRLVIVMGWKRFNWWVKQTDPLGYHFLIFKNGQGQTKVANHNAVCPLLCYGDFKARQQKTHWNFTESCLDTLNSFLMTYDATMIPNGFLRENYQEEQAVKLSKNYEILSPLKDTHVYAHPSPKPFKDWLKMIRELNPKNIYDPFGGTAPVAQVGEYLGIPYYVSELNPLYRKDAIYRQQLGINQRKASITSSHVTTSQCNLQKYFT
jgi:hypothetical protein